MSNPSLPIAGTAVIISIGTMISKSTLITLKVISLFYVGIAKVCYVSMGRSSCS
jgi:hypothetical protein